MSSELFVHVHAGHADWQAALEDCLSQLQVRIAEHAASGRSTAFTLGWCYLTDHFAPLAEDLLAELKKRLPAVAWVGTAGIGVSACGVEYFDEPGLALMLAPLPESSFRLFSGRQPLRAGDAEFEAHTAMVHAEGSTPDIQELLQEMSDRTATDYLFGGLSSARNRTLHIADEVFTGGLSGVAFGADVGLISRVSQGCQPIGPARTVTGCEENYVITLDGRPALQCVLEDLGLPADIAVEQLAEALSSTLVGLSSGTEDLPRWPGQFGPDTLVRHIVGVDPEHQVLAIADQAGADMQLAFCTRSPGAARSDLERIAGEIRDELESGKAGAALGAVYVSCSGRGGPHFGAPHAELQTVRDALGDLPLVGFFAGGEIARNHLFGYTGVLTVFTGPA